MPINLPPELTYEFIAQQYMNLLNNADEHIQGKAAVLKELKKLIDDTDVKNKVLDHAPSQEDKIIDQAIEAIQETLTIEEIKAGIGWRRWENEFKKRDIPVRYNCENLKSRVTKAYGWTENVSSRGNKLTNAVYLHTRVNSNKPIKEETMRDKALRIIKTAENTGDLKLALDGVKAIMQNQEDQTLNNILNRSKEIEDFEGQFITEDTVGSTGEGDRATGNNPPESNND